MSINKKAAKQQSWIPHYKIQVFIFSPDDQKTNCERIYQTPKLSFHANQ